MTVMLLSHTNEPDRICGQAAALCTGYTGNPVKALRGAMNSGHESVAEHAVFTFVVEGVSRVLLAQLTRHRLASFSVQSQRYCGAEPEDVVIPQSIKDKRLGGNMTMLMTRVAGTYQALLDEGVPEEDARFVLPQGITTRLMMTANARELRHFFSLRCCSRAQWEIRDLANEMLRQCREVAPMLFADAGPGCVRGHCPEGAKGCGRGKNNA